MSEKSTSPDISWFAALLFLITIPAAGLSFFDFFGLSLHSAIPGTSVPSIDYLLPLSVFFAALILMALARVIHSQKASQWHAQQVARTAQESARVALEYAQASDAASRQFQARHEALTQHTNELLKWIGEQKQKPPATL